MLVEAHGLGVLLVDGELAHAAVADRKPEQPPAQAAAPLLRRNEQHLQAARLRPHERHGASRLGHHQVLHAPQGLRDVRLDGLNLRVLQEQVSRPDGALPHVKEGVDKP